MAPAEQPPAKKGNAYRQLFDSLLSQEFPPPAGAIEEYGLLVSRLAAQTTIVLEAPSTPAVGYSEAEPARLAPLESSERLTHAEILAMFFDPSIPEQDWQERAVCAQTDPEIFFPAKGESSREAKGVCQSCEVRSECLEYALAHDEHFGIWGGLSERERRKLKKRA